MKRSRDPLALSPHWHVDLRLEAELPEDTIIGTRFIVNAVFGGVALGALLFVGWLGLITASLSREIHDWEKRISENRAEVADLDRLQREYSVEAAKIDQPHALVRPQFFAAEFLSNLGRSRPDQMTIDQIDWNDTGIVVRGSLKERSDRATLLLGGYVEQLRRDPKISPLCREIVVTDLDRGSTGDTLRFEINLRLKPGGP